MEPLELREDPLQDQLYLAVLLRLGRLEGLHVPALGAQRAVAHTLATLLVSISTSTGRY